MACDARIAILLADMVYDTCWGNRWHSLATATEELTDEDLAYRPVPEVRTPREVLRHAAAAARGYGNGLPPRTDEPWEDECDQLRGRPAARAADLVHVVEVACRRLHARAQRVRDDQLGERSRVWNHALKGFVLMDGAILHAAWHFGQIAMLAGWRRAQAQAGPTRPSSPPPGRARYPGRRDWTDFHVASRRDVCVRLLRAAYEESPWHSLRKAIYAASPGELEWSPFRDRRGPLIAMHVAHCKVIYADQAFGRATLGWGDCDRLIGSTWDRPEAEKVIAALDRAQAFLCDHVAAASDEDLDRVNPMHHGVAHTGWQVVASMAQHDAWHGGQIAIMRDVYAALAKEPT